MLGYQRQFKLSKSKEEGRYYSHGEMCQCVLLGRAREADGQAGETKSAGYDR